MDTTSAAAVARELGTNVPRVLRAVDRLCLGAPREAGGTLRLTAENVDRLREELGVVVDVPELRRTQVQVLAALVRAPMGLRSARAVGRLAGLSPSAAGSALRVLEGVGLVTRQVETVAEGGAREVAVFRVNYAHPRWSELAPRLAQVRPRSMFRPADHRVPPRLAHVFWNAPVRDIDVREHGPYVARRVLLNGDTQALAWAARTLQATDWLAAAHTRGLEPRLRALATNLAAAAG
jgi:DNA-binding transcriptional ArsR family regulator